ncbi:TonB family protein [Pontiellaceae bacterium B1224]|nr:TonB family protein [Pontiellaceae bacterium B1224]
MQKRNTIVNIPLIGGISLSIAVHAAALYSRGVYTPAKPQLEAGRTVVQLTLIPSVAAKSAETEPVIDPDPEPLAEPEPIFTPVPVVASVPALEPVIKPTEEPKSEPVLEATPEPAMEDATEQIASMIEEKGVVTQASPIVGIRATYPRSSQRRGHEGTVVLSIQVLKNGKAGKVTVLSSSGYPRLDEAAVDAAKSANYSPAQQFGNPVEAHLTQPVTFELTR